MTAIPNSETGPQPDIPWNSEWMRGLLPLLVLQSLCDGPSYGYAIISTLASHGIGGVKGGTLYPLLARQQAASLVTTEWRPGDAGPGRKFFALTPQGREHARSLAEHWAHFSTTTRALTDGALDRGERR